MQRGWLAKQPSPNKLTSCSAGGAAAQQFDSTSSQDWSQHSDTSHQSILFPSPRLQLFEDGTVAVPVAVLKDDGEVRDREGRCGDRDPDYAEVRRLPRRLAPGFALPDLPLQARRHAACQHAMHVPTTVQQLCRSARAPHPPGHPPVQPSERGSAEAVAMDSEGEGSEGSGRAASM